ncbi:MAG TPA: diguanylate cyclase [Nocardioides sp.]|nr:diguanylate cyclase [Nocardioides sp.]
MTWLVLLAVASAVVATGAVAVAVRAVRTRESAAAEVTDLRVALAAAEAERDRASTELERRAATDDLTGLDNRSGLVAHLTDQLGDRRQETALVVVGLDDFAAVNDHFGPGVGDAVLVETARRLRATLRPEDVAARLAGTEFAVVVPDASAVGVAAVSDRLTAAAAQPHDVDGFPLRLRPCTGVAWSQGRRDPELLVREARTAMHEARAAGPHQIRTYDERSRSVPLHHVSLRLELPEAVESRRVSLAFQAVARLSDGALTGLTAIPTWVRSDGEVVGGAELVRLADESGWGPSLTRIVLEEAAGQLATWLDQGHLLDLHVLAPRHHLDDPETLLAAHAACDRVRDGVHLVLETEPGAPGAGGDDRATARTDEALLGLQARGALLACSSWGTATGLADLARTPWDLVVVPADLLGDHPAQRTGLVARGIADLAGLLDLRLLVTGVDRVEEARAWSALGGDVGRGALHGPARSPYALDAMLQRRTLARSRAVL